MRKNVCFAVTAGLVGALALGGPTLVQATGDSAEAGTPVIVEAATADASQAKADEAATADKATDKAPATEAADEQQPADAKTTDDAETTPEEDKTPAGDEATDEATPGDAEAGKDDATDKSEFTAGDQQTPDETTDPSGDAGQTPGDTQTPGDETKQEDPIDFLGNFPTQWHLAGATDLAGGNVFIDEGFSFSFDLAAPVDDTEKWPSADKRFNVSTQIPGGEESEIKVVASTLTCDNDAVASVVDSGVYPWGATHVVSFENKGTGTAHFTWTVTYTENGVEKQAVRHFSMTVFNSNEKPTEQPTGGDQQTTTGGDQQTTPDDEGTKTPAGDTTKKPASDTKGDTKASAKADTAAKANDNATLPTTGDPALLAGGIASLVGTAAVVAGVRSKKRQ